MSIGRFHFHVLMDIVINLYLGKSNQTKENTDTLSIPRKDAKNGHSSYEDAVASLRLFKLKLAKDKGLVT